MRFWWASQNQTYRQETEGGYLWSPKRNKDGKKNAYYEFMKELAPGDIVFSFADTWIKKIGIVQGYCHESPRPLEFGALGERAWNDIGWSVKVAFFRITKEFRPKDHIDQIRPLLPKLYSPLQGAGDGNVLYLTALSDGLAHHFGTLVGSEYTALLATAAKIAVDETVRGTTDFEERERWERRLIDEVTKDTNLTATERDALVQARIGQGRFRKNLAKVETHCRVTKVHEPAHLRASHTKPWRSSTNEERLNGENGLLLTPTVDHLFDRGFISFEDNGDLLISPVAVRVSLQRMGIDPDLYTNVGNFSTGQKVFLHYHRESVFLARMEDKMKRLRGDRQFPDHS
jgi:putative restriction endonuclease